LFPHLPDFTYSPIPQLPLIKTTLMPKIPYFLSLKQNITAFNSLKGLLSLKVYGNEELKNKDIGDVHHHQNKNIDIDID